VRTRSPALRKQEADTLACSTVPPAGNNPQRDRQRIAAAVRDARSRLEAALTGEPSERAILTPALQALITAEAALTEAGDDPISSAVEPPAEDLRRRITKLEQALQARDEFISTVGHELKNPLSPVFIHAEQILKGAREAPGGVVTTEWLIPRLESFTHRFRRFLQTLNRILDVSRISSGTIALHTEDVDMVEVMREIIDSMERERVASKSELTLHAEGKVIGRWDRLRIEQICGNLLSNAIRYGLSGPIDIFIEAHGDAATLKVRDRGLGIAEADQARIFDRFERAAGVTRTGGFGVGLWVVKKLCTAMGGDVAVQSKISEGSTFTVTLPRDERRSA
jgi:signal transduction histidine kinase